jgi:hypothetical protein
VTRPSPGHTRRTVALADLAPGDVLIFPHAWTDGVHAWEVWRPAPTYAVGDAVQRAGHPEWNGTVSGFEEGSPRVRFPRGEAVVPASELEPFRGAR